jgi:chemotaxis protein CheX
MDVKFINPFLNGTQEVLKKMAFMDAVPGKPYLKKEETASGDVSGIIGITGDATGSLALSFSEKCICKIVSNMLGEEHHEVTRDIIDAVGELTNMVSGASRTQLEKMGMAVYAAIPTVVHGQEHTITHILKSPSIVIPFSTAAGPFFIDVCIKTTEAVEKSTAQYGVVGAPTQQNPRPSPPAASQATTQASPGAPAAPRIDIRPNAQGGPGKPVNFAEAKAGAAGKLEILRARLKEISATRNSIQNDLNTKPFMDVTKRQKMKKEVSFYDGQMKQLKLDIMGLEMVSKLSLEDIENPKIPKNYQNYDDNRKS